MRSWILREPIQMVRHLQTSTWICWSTDRRLFFFFIAVGNRKSSPSLVRVPSRWNIYRVYTHSSAVITGPMVSLLGFLGGLPWGCTFKARNQSEKQLQRLVCRWMAAMKSPLSALKASCGTGKRFKGLRRRMRRWIQRYSTQRRASALILAEWPASESLLNASSWQWAEKEIKSRHLCLRPALQPRLHQHPCLFPVITVIPVFVWHSTWNL